MVKRRLKSNSNEVLYNKRRQAYMKAAGYKVPQDGSWGPWQQSIWDKLTTRQKQYDTTWTGLFNGIVDKITGNTTYKVDPLEASTVRKYNPDEVDWDKTRRSQSKVVNALSGTWGPIVAAAMSPALAAQAIHAPLVTAATMAGGYAGGKLADKASKTLTGRDIGTNVAMHSPLTPGMGDVLNPGYVVGGGYGNFVGNNLANRERYTLNYLNPVSYKGHAGELMTLFTKPFYEAPPTFYGGRKPAWYANYAQREGADAAEQRFQNGLVWADIPETEAAHPMYVQNADGSYRLTPEGIGYKNFSMDALPNSTETFDDFFTRAGVGGEHSNYTELGDWMGAKLMEFKDEQKLNPQWLITDPIKSIFPEGTKAYKFLHQLGGKPLDRLGGYKPFTIKQNYIHTGNKVYPLYDDPANTSNIPNFIIHSNSTH